MDAAWQKSHRARRPLPMPKVALNQEFGSGPWDLAKVFRDDPRGAYLDLMEPLVYTSFLTYTTTQGTPYSTWYGNSWGGTWADDYGANASGPGGMSGGGTWERLYAVEQDPSQGGAHMRAIVDHGAKRVILAFRGACLNTQYPQCVTDMCAVYLARNGVNSTISTCQHIALNLGVYIEEATADINRTRALLGPDYAIMVTGHSLGGLLTLTAGATDVLPGVQYVGLEPTPYGLVLRQVLNLTDDQLAKLNVANRYAVYDPTDLWSTSYGPLDVYRPATTVCVYDGVPPPVECTDCVAAVQAASNGVNSTAAMEYCFTQPVSPIYGNSLCKEAVHFLDNYVDVLLKLRHPDGSVVVPTCQAVGVA